MVFRLLRLRIIDFEISNLEIEQRIVDVTGLEELF
jgi:hypothetical protein